MAAAEGIEMGRSLLRGRDRSPAPARKPTTKPMKPAAFDYARPKSLDEACAMLAEGEDVRIIAGGQTLVPLMAMRLARPRLLIDIARIPDLAYIRREGDCRRDRRHHQAMPARARPARPRRAAAAGQGRPVHRPCADPRARHRRRLARQRRSGGGDRAGRRHARRHAVLSRRTARPPTSRRPNSSSVR